MVLGVPILKYCRVFVLILSTTLCWLKVVCHEKSILEQKKLKSACAAMQSDQSVLFLHQSLALESF